METIALSYTKKNRAAQKIIDGILATGFFQVEKRKTGLELALEDIDAGRTTTHNSVDELLKKLKT